MTKTRSSRCISDWSASLSASAIVSSRPARVAGSLTSAWGAYTDASISSTVGSGLDLANSTARSSSRRSEEHTSELQSLAYLVCRLLLEKKKKNVTRLMHVTNHDLSISYN